MGLTAHMAYAYAGGFTQGVKPYFQVNHAYEDAKPYGAATSRLNHPDVEIHPALWPQPDPADAIFANPPCAPFSSAGYGTNRNGSSWIDDPRLQCHRNVVELGVKSQAQAIVIESVPLSTRARPFFESLTPPTYHLTELPHNACEITDTPQSRKRIFWIYTAEPFQPLILSAQAQRVLTPLDIPGDPNLPPPRRLPDQLRELLPEVPQWAKLSHVWQEHGITARGKPSMNCRRLQWLRPTPTISGTYGYAHPEESRYLGVDELARICGYPADYQWAPRSSSMMLLEMVRAVMPPVASWLARIIEAQIERRDCSF